MAEEKYKIAIVEDDLKISQMYRMKFEALGWTVETADNGEDGLDMVKEMMPDIILLDLMMPGINGDEVLARIRETDWGKEIIVVILTNMGKEEAPERLKNLNVRSYIVKAEMTPRQVAEEIVSILEG